ncbi:MAG: aspartate aminotransferase family protein [Chloroflexota bacterium]
MLTKNEEMMNHVLKCHDIVKTDFVRGENCSLYDSRGKRFVDLESGIWCTVLGHSHPRLNRVMQQQIEKLVHLGTRYPNNLVEEAAIAVLDIVGIEPGKCVFLSSGSEAVEFAVQIARRVIEKPLLLTFSNSYLAAYGSAGRKSNNEWCLFDWAMVANHEQMDEMSSIPFEKIGAFVFEPGGSGSGFVKFPPKQIVQRIALRIKQAGGLIIANEVTTGMGRTGKWFGFQHYDIQPDIVALGKGLGNGYPVSAVAMRLEIAEKLEKCGFRYAQSHQNDPLGCSIAKEVIATMREENWIERGNRVGTSLLQGLKRLEEKYAVVKEVRGRGMLLGIELCSNEHLSVEGLYHALLEEGFLVGYYPAGNVLRLDPSLTIEEEDVSRFLDCLNLILETHADHV